MILINILTILIPGIPGKSVFAQSTYVENKLVEQDSSTRQKHTITSVPKPDSNIPKRVVDGVDSTFSGRNSISIRSTDAGIMPIYQQPSECMNCGIVDFFEPGYAASIISGGIISGVIGSKIFRRETHKYPGRHFNGGLVNYYDIGIAMDDGTQTIIKQQSAPYFHSGDKLQLNDGVPQLNN